MYINDALNLLKLTIPSTKAEIKKAYRVACLKFHPDRNPAGAQMMVAINAAYETLKVLGDVLEDQANFEETNYAEELNEVLNSLLTLEGLILEVCGNWIWISGDSKPHKKALGKDGLKCFWSNPKKMWYYRPAEYKSSSRKSTGMDDIRAKYGSSAAKQTTRKSLAA
jgi:hypothetical protein